MTFFERYFELLDGPEPLRALDLVAEDLEFSIQWAAGTDRKSTQFLGGIEELRGFTDAGDTTGWAHHVVWSGTDGGVEFALGETRWDDSGERIGTFLAVAELDDDRRMRRYMVARTPGLAFPTEAPMLDERELQPVAEGLIAGTASRPELIGSACRDCGTVTFPRQGSCARCASEDMEERRLARRGTLWTWTVQCFPPKSPPYAVADPADFQPYGVGYVELPGEVRVEARLTESDPERLRIGMPMELTLIPAPGASGAMTYAFRPIEEDA